MFVYELSGMTPNAFFGLRGRVDADNIDIDDINMDELRRQFKIHCTDYMEDLDPDLKTKAVEFCSKVLHGIESEARKVKSRGGNKIWKFYFDVSGQIHVVFIVSGRREAVNDLLRSNDPSMVLSVLEAGLLAQETFSQIVELAYQYGKKLMTPLALACFSKDNVAKLAEELKITEVLLLKIINQSIFYYGPHLPMADVDISTCSLMAISRNFRNEDVKKRECKKLLKKFIAKGKMPSMDRIVIISRYVTGGIPVEFVNEVLKSVINSK